MANNRVTISTTRTIKFIKSGFRRDYDKLNEMIFEWYYGLEGEGRLCLAISRKAPRLLEWCQQTFSHGNSPLHVVSELALPFVDMSNYHTCTVVDEAIYNGTTFSKVLSIANCMGNSEYTIEAKPLVLTSDALENVSIMQKLVPTRKIEKRDTHFFIDAIISKFLTLGKSYDIEHPIFYIDLRDDIDEDKMKTILEKFTVIELEKRNLGKDETYYYVTKTYSREEKKDYYSYTYLTDYLYKTLPADVWPEFAKLRFFKKGNRLSIVSMSPYVISDDYLNKVDTKFDRYLDRVWRYIKACSEKTNVGFVDEEYLYQKKKSLIVMVNYLLSFTQFLSIKDSLVQALLGENLSLLRVEEPDLIYLLGETVGKQVAVMLNEILVYHSNDGVVTYPVGHIDGAVIPQNYADGYRFWMNIDNLDKRAITLSQMVSNQFSAMHWYVELPSRSFDKKFNRLRFGESYYSLYKRYQGYFKPGTETIRLVNQAIDSRIDRGSIVPNYVRHETDTSAYWSRVFRSGENEDYDKDQLLRTMVHIFQTYCDKRGGNIMHKAEMQLILGLLVIIGEYTKDGNHVIFGRKLSAEYNHGYKFLASLEDSEEDLIDFTINNKVFMLEDDEFLRLTDTTYAHELTLGVGMSNADEEVLDSYIEFVDQLRVANYGLSELREVLNYLMYSTTRMEESIHCFYSNLRELVNSEKAFDFDEMDAEFRTLYMRMPEPYLSINRSPDLSLSIYESVRKVMQPINDKLKDQNLFDKLITAYYILNVWSVVNFEGLSSRFPLDRIEEQSYYLSEKDKKFSDGINAFEWIKENDSYAKLSHLPKGELKGRLLELLSMIQ